MATLVDDLRNCRITGPLHVRIDKKDTWLQFTNVTFEEPVDFSGTCARGIAFHHCVFRKGVNLSGVCLSGSLIACKTEFLTAAGGKEVGLRLDGARLSDALRVIACTVEGGVVGENARIGGNADFRGLRVYAKGAAPLAALLQNLGDKDEFSSAFGHGYPRLGCAFRLEGTRVDGNLSLGALYDERIKGFPDAAARFPRISFLGGDVQLANVEILGDLHLSGLATTGAVSLENSVVKGNIEAESRLHASGRVVRFVAGDVVNLYGVQIGGNLLLHSAYLARGANICFATVGGYLFAKPRPNVGPMAPLEIGVHENRVSLDLSGSRIGGVECEGVKMTGQVRVSTGEFGRFVMTPLAANAGLPTMTISPCEVASIFMRSVTIKENARFHGILVKGTPSDESVTERGFNGALQLINCSVGGDLAIGSDGLCRHVSPGLPADWEPAVGRAPVSSVCGFASGRRPSSQQIAARQQWSTFDASYPTRVDRLNLSGTKVDRDLNVTGFAAAKDIRLDHVTVGGDTRMSQISDVYGVRAVVPEFRTRCRSVLADGLRCEGDVDLTGVKAEDDVRARHLKAGGSLLLVGEDLSTGPSDATGAVDLSNACADIGGNVDFQNASAAMFLLSSRNFNHDRGSLVLSDTHFHKISIREADALPARAGLLLFPNANIDRWDVDWTSAFHRKTEPVDAGAYASIENYLREDGRFHEANRVLIDRVRRTTLRSFSKDVSKPSALWGRPLAEPLRWLCAPFKWLWIGLSWLSTALVWAIGEFIGYGTRPLPSFAVIVVALLWSTVLFSNPKNVDISTAFRARLAGVDAREIHPGDARWRDYCTSDPDCVAIGNHWNGWSAFALALRYSVPLAGAAVEDVWKPTMSVSQTARWLSLVSWICWPVFVGTLTRYILRRL